ncbi:hypothetical protein JTE90_015167 [Oedothorax gibbosus]|uniref:TRASH domain-containing protein n=1 Tax=Oedothorax gibbosus TaxID=931172 RepID=A0AAV6V7U4_9ARAC|nr:hypothetical protein JTE90_015167 [Oedothorax gibbosus]
MADTTTDSDLMEVEDSSDSIQIDKNGVSEENDETKSKLAKTPSDSAEPMEEDSLSSSMHDLEAEDSIINESENKEDTNDNASDSLEVPIVESADTTAVEPEDLNGDVSLVEPPDTTAEESIDTNGDVSLVDKECEDNIDNDISMDNDSNIDNDPNIDKDNNVDNDNKIDKDNNIDDDNNVDRDNKIDNEAVSVEAETTVSSAVSEKQIVSDSETDSPKPSALRDVLTEESSKNSPEVVSNLCPFVKDAANEDAKAKDVKEKQNDEKVDSTENIDELDSKEKEGKTEHKEKSKSSKKKKAKTCSNCGVKQKHPLRIVFQGKSMYLCSETCFKVFKEKNMTKPVPKFVDDNCAQCQTRISNEPAFFPCVGEVKPLCTEECLMKYQEKHSIPTYCGQCKERIQSAYQRLTWETMVFCNDTCLVKYQTDLGSHCTSCHSPVQKTSLGKYCVCFGSDIRQFCSGSCLEEFKKGLKICSFCQNDLSTAGEGFLAPVGDKGQFKDFCSPICMDRYEVVNNIAKVMPEARECYNCKNKGVYKIQVKHGNENYALCSDLCLSAFRCAFRIMDNICLNCFQHFKTNEEEVFSFIFEGFPKNFCAKSCMTLFVLSNRKIINCLNCKVKKYNFDMIERLDSNNQFQMFCSSYCLNSYRVHSSGTGVKINCDGCNKNKGIQFHLTMSDGSMLNFCAYECVIAFQKEKHGMLPSNSHGVTTTTSISNPVISNVMSLAQEFRSGLSPQSQVKPRLPQHPLMPPGYASTGNSIQQPPKIQSPSLSAVNSSTLTVANTGGAMKEIIVRPPPPKPLRNKSASCKPIMATKGISCKSQTCNKAVQTDDTRLPSILPVPFPVYIPCPVNMYTKTISVPMPFPVPVPIPIPVFINKEKPCSRQHVCEVSSMETETTETLETKSTETVETKLAESIKTKSPEIPETYSAESLGSTSAESTKTNSTEPLDVSLHKDDPSPQVCSTTILENNLPAPSETKDIACEASKEAESVLPASENSTPQVTEQKNNSQESQLASNTATNLETKTEPIDEDLPTEFKQRRKKRSGEDLIVTEGKKAKVDEDYIEYMYGVNAWKQWVALKNGLMERGSSRKFKSFKTDLLLLSPSELSYSLSLFVKEVSKPNGQPYSAGTLFYLLLGIQYYMNENGRTDDLFSDEVYSSFAEHFHDVLLQYEGRAMGQEYPNPRIKESFLWQSKQLGAQSPQILLNTLMYFNAQFFKLRTVAAHMGLNFSHIARHTDEKGSFLRYYKEDNGKKEEENMNEFGRENHLIQSENKEDIMRCPVRLFEFYVSKCPQHLLETDSRFYLTPEKHCTPHSPIWYSAVPLNRAILAKTIQRNKLIEDLYKFDNNPLNG